MADRRRVPSIYEGRSYQEPGMMRHGPLPRSSSSSHRPTEPHIPTNHVEAKLAAQLSEIERLAGDNRMLASSHVALKEDLIASQLEVQKLRDYMRSIETESTLQIRVLLEKIAKMEVDLRAGESLKNEYQRDYMEAQSLVKAREELIVQLQEKTKQLEKARADIKRLPDMRAELDNLRQEHQRLRTTFQYEKSLNVDKVEKMKVLEKDLVGMAREVEVLRAEVLNAENKARVVNPYPDPIMHSNAVHSPLIHGNGPFPESYGIPHTHQALGSMGEAMAHGVSGSMVWRGTHVAPPPPR